MHAKPARMARACLAQNGEKSLRARLVRFPEGGMLLGRSSAMLTTYYVSKYRRLEKILIAKSGEQQWKEVAECDMQ